MARMFSIPDKYLPGKVKATKPDPGIGNAVEEKCSGRLPTGVVITVVLGDITCEQSDCIVNGANSRLVHAGGLARAIVQKGGAAIRRESEKWIDSHGMVPTGGLAVTSGGALPHAAYVLHVVGPMYTDGVSGEPELLKKSINAVLVKAAELRVQVISIPAISSGIFKFPKDQCADILVAETLAFVEKHADALSLKEVRFTNFDSETVGYFERSFAKLVQPQLTDSAGSSGDEPQEAAAAVPPAAEAPLSPVQCPAGDK